VAGVFDHHLLVGAAGRLITLQYGPGLAQHGLRWEGFGPRPAGEPSGGPEHSRTICRRIGDRAVMAAANPQDRRLRLDSVQTLRVTCIFGRRGIQHPPATGCLKRPARGFDTVPRLVPGADVGLQSSRHQVVLAGGDKGWLVDQPAQQGARREGVIETVVIGRDQAEQLGVRQAAAGAGEILAAGGALRILGPAEAIGRARIDQGHRREASARLRQEAPYHRAPHRASHQVDARQPQMVEQRQGIVRQIGHAPARVDLLVRVRRAEATLVRRDPPIGAGQTHHHLFPPGGGGDIAVQEQDRYPGLGAGEQDPGGDPRSGNRPRDSAGQGWNGGWNRQADVMPRSGLGPPPGPGRLARAPPSAPCRRALPGIVDN